MADARYSLFLKIQTQQIHKVDIHNYPTLGWLTGSNLLRVVRCLPLIPGLPDNSRTLRAGVGQAPREETAGYKPRLISTGDGLWGFE
jgi:hypothetical protein